LSKNIVGINDRQDSQTNEPVVFKESDKKFHKASTYLPCNFTTKKTKQG